MSWSVQVRLAMTCHERAQPIVAGACKKRSIKHDHQDQCDINQRNAIGPGAVQGDVHQKKNNWFQGRSINRFSP